MIPLILAAVAGVKAIDTAINFAGGQQQKKIDIQQGAMERDIYGKNAALAESQAADAEARGQQAAVKQVFQEKDLLGAQRAAFAGQGVKVGAGGSAGAVQASDFAVSEVDRLNILENARREAWGYRQQADIYNSQGALAYAAGVNQARMVGYKQASTLANFAGDMFSLYKGYTAGEFG